MAVALGSHCVGTLHGCDGADVAVAGMETKKGDPLWSRLLQKCIPTLSFSLSKFSFCYPKAKDSHRDYTCAYV